MEQKRGLALFHPTARLIIFIVLSTLFTISQSWWAVLVSLAVGLGLLILGGKYPRPAIVACVSAGILTFLGNALFASETADISFLVFHISRESLLEGLRLGLRIMAMILPAIALIAVTPLHEYLVAFRGLRIPAVAEMYLTVVFRYVDILWYEIQISMKAMAMRGVNWEGSIKEKIPAFRRLMLPLIFRILVHVDGQSLAIDNRGGISAHRHILDHEDGRPALLMQDVFVRYDSDEDLTDQHAVSGLNLNIEKGSSTILLGRTGAGKTTTMLLSAGLIPHSVGRMRGQVQLFGHDTRQTPLNQLGGMARVVLTSAVQGLVGLTVRDELKISLRASTLKTEEQPPAMVQALETVGLDATFLDRLTLGLSGGEMQRVALASAIVARPMLLALDDVTMQLDPRGKLDVVAALHTLMEQKITKIMCDAHVSLLEATGSRFIRLEEGRVVDDKTVLDVEAVEAAGLRVPQMWSLGQKLGCCLPILPMEAAPLLRDLAGLTHPLADPPTSAEGNPIVSARGLMYAYPHGPVALKGINLDFRSGEFVAILGSNGSGKTTLALLLAGAMAPTAGKVLVEGQSFNRKIHRGYIGYVFQEPLNQMVTMNMKDELAFGPLQLGWDEAAVERAVQRELDRFGLSAEAVPLNLLPAEARKLSIAATLAMQPRMIILDEPTNNLDASDVDQLMAHLKDLQREGTTVVLITHDIDIALHYADRLVVMSDGAVLVEGPTRAVAARPDLLSQSDVVVSPVVELSQILWPDQPPALTVDEIHSWLQMPIAETMAER